MERSGSEAQNIWSISPPAIISCFRPAVPGLIWVEAARLGKKTAKKAGPVIRGRAGPCDYNWVRLAERRRRWKRARVRREAASTFCKPVGPPAAAHGGPGGRGQIV